MILLTSDMVNQIFGIGPKTSASQMPFLIPAMERFEITTKLRAAAFLATIAHESNCLKNYVEIWGPTPAQERYEGNLDLGNTFKGDGYKYRGRGAIQITGRSNYQKASKALGEDFVLWPDKLSSPMWAIESAAWWWKDHGCNKLADKPDFKAVTRRVNGGYNGMEERQKFYDKALAVLPEAPDFSNVQAGVETSA